MSAPDDGRSPLAQGVYWSTRVSSIGMMMVVPAVMGYFVDRWLGWNPACTVLGAILGFILAFYELLKFAQAQAKTTRFRPRGNDSSGTATSEPQSLSRTSAARPVDTSKPTSTTPSDRPEDSRHP